MKLILPLLILFALTCKVGSTQQKNTHYTFEEVVEKSIAFAEKEQFIEAAQELEKLNPNDSSYSDVLTSIAYYYLQAGENQKCIDFCNEGIKITKFNTVYYFYLNKIAALSRLDQNEEAIVVANEAIKRFPKSHTLHFNRAISYEETGDIKKAVDDLLQSLLINPYHPKSHLRLANLCAQQNQTAQALMCLNTYLMLSPDEEYSSRVLSMGNLLASRKDPFKVGQKISITKNDADFEELNLILNNKIALNKKYKTKNKIRSSLAIQSHAMLEQLKQYNTKGGFWNEKYVPFFKWIADNNHYNDMVYTTHYDSDFAKHKAIANKNTSAVKKFVPEVYTKWSDIVGENKVEVDGKEITQYHFYEDLKLVGIGEIKDENLEGHWFFYNKNGALSTSGKFVQGKRSGEWKAYTEDGKVERAVSYVNDELDGPFKTYNNGVLQHESNYTNGKANGVVVNYASNGALKNKMHYKDDLLNGIYEVFYKNGVSTNYKLNYKNDKADGSINNYFKNGALYSTVKFENDERSGLETTYYNDSGIFSKLTYKEGVLDGEQFYYHENGNISNKGLTINGSDEGEWVTFYKDGTKESVNNYENGVLNGKQTNYNRNGIINSEYSYKKGDFISFKTFDQEGNLLKETKKQNGKFYFSTTYTNGNLRTEGLYNVKGGKVGEWKYYSKNGYLMSLENFSEEGNLEGITTGYFSNGAISTEKNYKNGVLDGPYYSYYINGTLHKQGQYINGKVEGEWTNYYRNGSPSWVGYYNNGKYFGKAISYSVDKHITEIDYFYDDQLYREEIYYDTTTPPTVLEWPYSANGVSTKTYNDGKVKSTSELKYSYLDGEFKYYDINGQLHVEGNFILGDKEGVWTWKHENGKLETVGAYRLGEKHGPWTSYHDNGQVEEEENFVFGKEHGLFRDYNEKGILIRESQYYDGKFHGYRKFYGNNGNLQLIRYYEHDYLIGYSYLGKDGKELPMIKIKNETAKIKSFYKNGKVARELEIIKGAFNGSYKEYYYTGQLQEIQHYENTINVGEHLLYYPNGQVKKESVYKNNRTDGKVTYYYEDGTIKRIEHYMEDNLVGEAYYFNKKGEKTKTYIYFNDGLVGQK